MCSFEKAPVSMRKMQCVFHFLTVLMALNEEMPPHFSFLMSFFNVKLPTCSVHSSFLAIRNMKHNLVVLLYYFQIITSPMA